MKYIFWVLLSVCVKVHAVSLNPSHWISQIDASRAFARGDYERAKSSLAPLLEQSESYPDAIFNAGVTAYALHDWQKAAAYFDEASQHLHASGDLKKQAYYNRGNALTHANQLEMALDAYKKVRELDPLHEAAAKMIEQIERELKKRAQQQSDQKKSSEKQEKSDTPKKEKKDEQSHDQSSDENKDDHQQQSDQKDERDGMNDSHRSSDQRDTTGNENNNQPNNQEQQEKSGNDAKNTEKNGDETGAGNTSETGQQKPFDQPTSNQKKDNQYDAQDKHSSLPEKGTSDPHSTDNSRKIKASSDSKAPIDYDHKENDERFSPADQQLMKLLDQHDAQSLKQLLKVDVKNSMQGHHGQKNW